MTIRIAIGCHSYLLGEGLKRLFKHDDAVEIIGIFDEGIDIQEIVKLEPDIILTDFKIFRSLPHAFLETNTIKIIIISDGAWLRENENQIPELISRGVAGIMAPDSDSGRLREAVRVVFSGELWLDRKLIKNLLTNMRTFDKKIDLTRKEREIVTLICHGCRNKEIAQQLDISEQTVKSHCNRIFKKVGVSDRLQLALYTRRMWPGIF
ncbi:MAG: LuxR C-terminal-related transcriptional regulator [Nitrospirota bacterium]